MILELTAVLLAPQRHETAFKTGLPVQTGGSLADPAENFAGSTFSCHI